MVTKKLALSVLVRELNVIRDGWKVLSKGA